MRWLAYRICELRPRAADAVLLIRRYRTDTRGDAGSSDGLADELCNLLDDYRARHPGVTYEQITRALRVVFDATEVASCNVAPITCDADPLKVTEAA
jgi:hypothetical protein